MVSFSMTLSDHKSEFQDHCILTSRISQKRCVLGTKLLKNTNRKPYTIYLSSRRLCDLLESYDMTCKVNSATHDCGGLLDIVAARDKLTTTVEVMDPEFSEHRLLRSTCSLDKLSLVYESVIRLSWRSLDVSEFKR